MAENPKAGALRSHIALIAGVLIAALSYALFFLPNSIAPGGFTGFAMILNRLFGFPVGITVIALNLPLFWTSFRRIGWAFGIRSFLAMTALSLLIDFLPQFPLTLDPLLGSVYGGVMMGMGIGLIIRSSATTGGTDMLAMILHRVLRVSFSVGTLLFIIDMFVVVMAGIVFEPQAALYAIIALFISSRIIDMIQEGVSSAKAFFIITCAPEAIGARIMEELGRGATALQGRGMYTGEERDVLFCIVRREEVGKLKRIIADEDPKAFVVVSDVREAMGEGFVPHKLNP